MGRGGGKSLIRGILDELKQRSVVRVAGVYAVAGWAVFQVIATLFPALDMPRWTVSLAALLFLAGFPVAIGLAWFFEIGEKGIRLAPRERRGFGGGRFGWIDWAVGAVVLGVFVFALLQVARLRTDGEPAMASAAPSQSVAVLPFASFSQMPEDGFFADGLTEELINSLAQSPELRVAGRTSSFYFKGRNEDLREIGRRLGVAHVVEGSVRRAGPRLRVTAQLIEVSSGFHLWSETFDRQVDDALAIQTEIAETVAGTLRTRIAGDAHRPASSPEAYRRALIARAQLRTQELGNLRSARASYSELRRDYPNEAGYQAGYAQATILLAQNFMAIGFDEARRESERAIERALAIDPRLAEAWLARGIFNRALAIRTGEGAYHREALAAFRRAYRINPRNPEAMALLGRQLVVENQPEQAIAILRRALATDPLSQTAQEFLAEALADQGAFAESRRVFETLVALYPDYTSARSSFASMLIFKLGALDEAARLLDDPALAADDPLNAFLFANATANMGVRGGPQLAGERVPQGSAAKPLSEMILLQLADRRAELLRYASDAAARTGDPLWQSLVVVESMLIGEQQAARATLPRSFPGLLADPPEVAGYRELDAVVTAAVLQRTGGEAQARTILERLLVRLDGIEHKGPDQLAARAMTLAALGRTDEAVAGFEAAQRAGWRLLIDFDYFVPVVDYPFMAEVARDPRFRRLAAEIQADNARMRENYLRARAARTAAAR